LAFWVLDVSAFILMLYALEFLAGGHVFPINLLPPALAHALMLTPFPYQLFFPVSIYLGQVSGTALWQGLAMQFFWVVASYGLARWIWHRGIRKYAAVGG
jgi:ABC-2 type transport system permease protein